MNKIKPYPSPLVVSCNIQEDEAHAEIVPKVQKHLSPLFLEEFSLPTLSEAYFFSNSSNKKISNVYFLFNIHFNFAALSKFVLACYHRSEAYLP